MRFPARSVAILVMLSWLLLISVLRAQNSTDSVSFRFSTVTHHPDNQVLERLSILEPSLRVSDFSRTYSPFDTGFILLGKLRQNSVFTSDIRYRFSQRGNPVSLSLGDDTNELIVEPILGYMSFSDNWGEWFHRRSNGLMLHGNLGDHVVFFASAVDNLEGGKVLDKKMELDPSNGFVISNDRGKQGFDFDETQLQIGFRWGDAQLFLEKMRNRWGYGETGSLVLSEKAPSYPQLRLVVPLTKKIRLTYLLASLYSDVIDTQVSYQDPVTGYNRNVYRSKYLAAHLLEYAPSAALNLAFGESMVFSDRFQPVYLLPLIFFRSAEHQNRNTDNAQIFGGIRYTLDSLGVFYGTLFIDDLNIDKIFSSQSTNIFAWTLGAKLIDIGWNNFDWTLEYTRLNPWVYTHQFEATTYTTDNYVLGHWLGQNADILYASAQYRWVRPLWLSLYAQKIRKGVLGPTEEHYAEPWTQKFLAGPLFKQLQVGIKARWEMCRYLFLSSDISVWTQTDDVQNRDPAYLNKPFFNFSLSYNFFE